MTTSVLYEATGRETDNIHETNAYENIVMDVFGSLLMVFVDGFLSSGMFKISQRERDKVRFRPRICTIRC